MGTWKGATRRGQEGARPAEDQRRSNHAVRESAGRDRHHAGHRAGDRGLEAGLRALGRRPVAHGGFPGRGLSPRRGGQLEDQLSGQHPGGEVSGLPGHNAAQEILKDLD